MAMKPAGVRRYHQSGASSNFRGGESDFEAARLARQQPSVAAFVQPFALVRHHARPSNAKVP